MHHQASQEHPVANAIRVVGDKRRSTTDAQQVELSNPIHDKQCNSNEGDDNGHNWKIEQDKQHNRNSMRVNSIELQFETS